MKSKHTQRDGWGELISRYGRRVSPSKFQRRRRINVCGQARNEYFLFIYLFSFFPVGRGTLLQVSPITAGPFVQVCSGGGNSPQHRH